MGSLASLEAGYVAPLTNGLRCFIGQGENGSVIGETAINPKSLDQGRGRLALGLVTNALAARPDPPLMRR